MHVAEWKRWQWIFLGLCCGAALAYFYGEPTPPANAARVSSETFQSDLVMAPLANGQRPISHLHIYPPHEGIYLVTFALAAEDGAGPGVKRCYLYAKTPFESDTGTDATILDYLKRISAGESGINYTYDWWKTEQWRYAIFAAAFAVIIGGAWPTVLARLVAAGYGPPKRIEPAYDLERFGRGKQPPAMTPKAPSAADMKQLEVMGDQLEKQLASSASGSNGSSISASPAGAPAAPMALSSTPLQPLAPETKEEKEYRGQFYPTARGGKPKPKADGFSLVELLVVIGIIAVLIAILLPALNRARQMANTITCAANLRSIGQGLAMYLVENNGTYPPAYLYVGHAITDGVQTPPGYADGYEHWSSYLYGSGKTPAKAFMCPAMNRGGLPPTNTTPDNLDPGQEIQSPGVVDKQAPRLAYTVNEAICPRNKFVIGFQGASRIYKYVKVGQIRDASGTILATEWVDFGLLIGRDTGTTNWIMSHRPVHGYIGSNGELDMFVIPPGTGYRRVTKQELDPDPETETGTSTRLDWVGRNHGHKNGYPDKRRTNFLYVDGHVVTKTLYETLEPFEWGERFYSLDPNSDLVGP